MNQIEEMEKKRFQFLHKLYELSGGDESRSFLLFEISEKLGFAEDLAEKIGQYLKGEGLIRYKEFDQGNGIVHITHRGVIEIEKALSNPDKPTNYFPPVNIISVGQMINSQIQQASPGASQVVSISESKYEDLKEIIKMLKDSVDKLQLQPQQLKEMQVEIDTIELQLTSPKPKTNIINECFNSTIRILEGVASNVIAFGLLEKLRGLI